MATPLHHVRTTWPARALAGLALLLTSLVAHAQPGPDTTTASAPPTVAVRVGWCYGLGGELELRPHTWGVTASGGYVPGYGPGGYLGVAWGLRPLDASGLVGEAGIFWGQPSPLRTAAAGLGVHALVGYALVPARRLSLRLVAGGGVPLSTPVSFELLAKLTAGVSF